MEIIDQVIKDGRVEMTLELIKELLKGKVAIELMGDKKTIDGIKASVWDWAFELGTIEAETSIGPIIINPDKEADDYMAKTPEFFRIDGTGRSPVIVAAELLSVESITLPWGTVKFTEDLGLIPMSKLTVKSAEDVC